MGFQRLKSLSHIYFARAALHMGKEKSIATKKIITDSSNFKDFTRRNAYYVDKTPEILELFDLDSNIILMPRPRRFGKTLFLSTLYYLFSNREQDASLFEETHIYPTPFFQEHFGRYPVISVTFKDVRQSNFEDLI